tara:strand:- start:182 stop:799 length:618 start_codon:yes stop_codon:yes gene_type:complete
MKRYFILLLLLGINLSLVAQDSPSENLRLGMFFTLDKNVSSDFVATFEDIGFSADYHKINYKAGLSAEYFLKNRFSLNSGVNYSNKNFTGTFTCATCLSISPWGPETIELQFIEIPVSIKYYFALGKLNMYADLGLINQYAIATEIFNRKYIISGKLGCGIEYNFNPKLAFQFFTEYNNGLTNMFEESDFKLKTISLGFGLVKKR